jgi:hypothetical protein
VSTSLMSLRGLRLVAVLPMAVVAAACGSSTSPSTTPPHPGAGSQSASPTANGSDLGALSARWKTTSAKITYEYSGGQGTAGAGTMTIYWMPPGSTRFDFGGAGATSIIIETAAGNYVCSAGFCVATPARAQGASNPLASLFTSPDELKAKIDEAHGTNVQTSDETIAGAKSHCFAFSGVVSGSAGQGRYCFTDDGVLTLIDGTSTETAGTDTTPGTSHFTMRATAVSTSVSADDFKPPFPVQGMPGAVPTP